MTLVESVRPRIRFTSPCATGVYPGCAGRGEPTLWRRLKLISSCSKSRAFTLSIVLGTRPPSSRCSRCSNIQGDDDAKSDHDRGPRRAYRRYGNPDLLRPERGRSRRRRNWRRCDRRVPRNLHGDRGERIEDGINERNGQRRRQHSGWREQRLESIGEPRACSSARHLARIRPRTAALGQAKSPGRSSISSGFCVRFRPARPGSRPCSS
jgi:hypothetical protein